MVVVVGGGGGGGYLTKQPAVAPGTAAAGNLDAVQFKLASMRSEKPIRAPPHPVSRMYLQC